MSRVFVTQRPAAKVDGRWEDKYDLSPAEHFGELVDLLPRGNVPLDLRPTVEALWRTLADADFGDDDYLLAIGDPVAIAAAVAVAVTLNDGRAAVLKWDRRNQQYTAFRIDVKNDGSSGPHPAACSRVPDRR